MAEFKVLFQPGSDLSIKVDAEDYNEAIELAHEKVPHDLVCARCSGWGQGYVLDVSGLDIEPYAVYDAEGTLVYEEVRRIDLVQQEANELARRVQGALVELTRLRSETPTEPTLHRILEPIEKALRGVR